MIELTRLKTFIYAADELSFSEAARHLHITQPTVSHHIKALEKELDVQLFDRTGAGLRLTEAGRLLLPWARKVLRDSIELKGMMDALHDGVVGDLRIACSTTAGKYVLPQLAARFSQRYPGIQVSILRCTPEHIVPRLLDGEANLGVVSYEMYSEEMELQEFFEDAITMVVASDHPWALRSSIQPSEVIGEPILMREETAGTRRVVLSELAKHDISLEDLNIFMQLGNAEAIVRTVAAGYGISFVSSLATECLLESGKVVSVHVEGLELSRKIYMARKRLAPPHRPQEAFWGFVHDSANLDLLQLADAR
ncbi:MAG: LysR family transcriptional regulator [Chloroflexi bacterium]|jgi:DNA-binding transcriptional LysR family regulator|nr:LysR family transcriptional regulator [Chloroflexota bacterium]